jgi:hypothetical protein
MALAGMENIPLEQQVNTQLAPVSGPDVRYQPAPLQPDEDAAQAAGASALTPAVPLPSGLSPSIADQLNKLGFASRVHQTADKLAAASPNPNAPGAWARSLVGATSSALAGFGNIASDIAAGAEKPVPLGAPGGIVGMARALQNRKQRQQEMQTEAFQKKHAMAQEQIDMMHVDQARRGMAKDDPELQMLDQNATGDQALLKTYTEGGINGEGAAPLLGEGMTQQEVADLIQQGKLNPTQMHRFADGKKATGEKDKYGNPVYEQTYSVVGDSPNVTLRDQGLVDRMNAAHVTADGKPVQLNQEVPGWVFGQMSQKLQNRETADQATRIARREADLKELSGKEKLDNQNLIEAYGQAYAKAHNDPNIEPQDAKIQAVNHMLNDPKNAGKTEQIQNLFFGSPEKWDKALTDFVNEQENKSIQNRITQLGLDPADRIGSLKKISEDKDANGNPTRVANAASHQLSITPEPEKETYRKDKAVEADKEKNQAPSTGYDLMTDEMQSQIASLPPDKKRFLDQYPKDVQGEIMNFGANPGAADFSKVFSRMTSKQAGLTPQQAWYAIGQIFPGVNQTTYPVMKKMYDSLTTGELGKQVQQYNNVIQHLGNAQDVILNANGGRNIAKILNVPLNKIEDEGYGPEAGIITAALQAPKQEINNLLAGGYSPKQEDTQAFDTILNPAATPAKLTGAFKQLAHIGAIRLNGIDDQYRRLFRKELPGALDQPTVNALNKLNVDDDTRQLLGAMNVGGSIYGDDKGHLAQHDLQRRPTIPQNAQTATGPNGHKIYTIDNGASWVDSTTGRPLGK